MMVLFQVFRDTALHCCISFITGAPQDSGISLQTVLELGPTVPLFGVCMGLQCIGEAFGGELYNMKSLNSSGLHRLSLIIDMASNLLVINSE